MVGGSGNVNGGQTYEGNFEERKALRSTGGRHGQSSYWTAKSSFFF